jgi:hypothetical protein
MLFSRKLMQNDYDGMDRQAGGDATRPTPTVTLHPSKLVFEHAIGANHPDRCAQPSLLHERGKRVYTDRAGRIVTHHTRFGFTMLLAVGEDPLEVIALRRKYQVWYQALIDLRLVLSDKLKSHQLNAELPLAPIAC